MGLGQHFWDAVAAVVAADDRGEDVTVLAEDLLQAEPLLAVQLQASLRALDTDALTRALTLTDGLPPSEDALIALGCAILAQGPDTFELALADPESLVRGWELGRGDVLLALNPAVTLGDARDADVHEHAGGHRGPGLLSISIGGSVLPGIRRVNDALADREGRVQRKQARWEQLFESRRIGDLIVHLEARPGGSRRVGRVRRTLPGFVEVVVEWDAPSGVTRVPAMFREVLDAVYDKADASRTLRASTARAWRVLHATLQMVDLAPDPPNEVVGAWVADERTICVVYDKRGCPTTGLRRELEPGIPVASLAHQIAVSELGEPLGSLWDGVHVDDHGIHWFSGDHPDWRAY